MNRAIGCAIRVRVYLPLVPVLVATMPIVNAALTVHCTPVGGSVVTGGAIVEVECFVTTNVSQGVRSGVLDLPCALLPEPGAIGSVTSIGLTVDPDGDGLNGPSSSGLVFLFQNGQAILDSAECTVTGIATQIVPCCYLQPGESRYFGTITYLVSTCAAGDFRMAAESVSQPPQPTDGTRFRDLTIDNALIPVIVVPMNLTVSTGACCAGPTCVQSSINETCCSIAYPSARWFDGRACADPVPCPECVDDTGCDDNVPCTADSCNTASGECVHFSDQDACDDGLFCNGLETCDVQVGCLGGSAPCAPELFCDEASDACIVPPIPTVSQWGLVLLALALLSAGKVRSLRRAT